MSVCILHPCAFLYSIMSLLRICSIFYVKYFACTCSSPQAFPLSKGLGTRLGGLTLPTWMSQTIRSSPHSTRWPGLHSLAHKIYMYFMGLHMLLLWLCHHSLAVPLYTVLLYCVIYNKNMYVYMFTWCYFSRHSLNDKSREMNVKLLIKLLIKCSPQVCSRLIDVRHLKHTHTSLKYSQCMVIQIWEM